jgi:hypothetical protein
MIGHGEGTDCSWGKLNSISDFLQDIAARPFRLPSIQSGSLEAAPADARGCGK